MSEWVEAEREGIRGYANNGSWLPRTSAVLDILFPGTMRYVDTSALDRGTRLHAAVLQGFRTGKWKQAGESLPPEDSKSFTSITQWVKQWVKTTVTAESVCLSTRYGYASRIDCAVILKSGAFVVPDWKFAEAHDVRYEIQAEAHRHLDFEQTPQVWIVSVNRDGVLRVRKHHEHPQHWAAYLSALNVLKYRLNHQPKGVSPCPPQSPQEKPAGHERKLIC